MEKFVRAFPEKKASETDMDEIKSFTESMKYFIV